MRAAARWSGWTAIAAAIPIVWGQQPPASSAPAPPARAVPATAVDRWDSVLLFARGNWCESLSFSFPPRGVSPPSALWLAAGAVPIQFVDRIQAIAVDASRGRGALGGGVPGKSGFVAVWWGGQGVSAGASVVGDSADLVTSLVFAPGGLLFAAAADRTIVAYDADPPQGAGAAQKPAALRKRFTLAGHSGAVLAVAAAGGRVASGSEDRTIRIWSESAGSLERALTQHAGAVNSLAFSPDGTRLLSASDDRTVRLWDPATGRLVRIVRGFEGSVLRVRWEGAGAFASSVDGRVYGLDLEEGKASPLTAACGEWIYDFLPISENDAKSILGPGSSGPHFVLATSAGLRFVPRQRN